MTKYSKEGGKWEVQTQVLQAVSKFLNIPIGQIPEKGGTVMELAPSSTPRRFFNGESYDQMSVIILSKGKSQKTTLESLNTACNKCVLSLFMQF